MVFENFCDNISSDSTKDLFVRIVELVYTMVVIEKCDVYSFGIVALETMMGIHQRNLVNLLSSSSTQNITLKDILDSLLSSSKGSRVAND